jgi:DNA-binding NarL/FixJ family response regulator
VYVNGREQLTRGVLRRERARARLHRLDPDDAVAEWSALVAGRWSLVDEVESDGRRFVIAHRNPAAAPPLAALTREQASVLGLALLGHSNKLIAYELGISEASVAMRLGRAGRKLGATSRVALLRRVSELLGRER